MAAAEANGGTETQVLIVGAGPTGLLLAAELVRRGVDCLLIDALDAPRAWDRATVVHSRSMEIFESLGLADRLLDRGVKTRGARIRSGGSVLGLLDIGLVQSRYPFDLGVSEEVTETVLTDHLEALGGAVTRSTRLIELSSTPDHVVATLEKEEVRRDVTAEYVVGCDGLHSAVRDHARIEFEGSDIQAPWAVFDATVEGWDEEFDVAASYMDTPAVILTPLPERRWRVYIRPTSEAGDLVDDATALLRQYKPDASFTDIENPVRFHCHARVATRFRDGRILLAGDAAHACSPAEGHGMNTGLQDAFNLGWKLALVCRGEAGSALLDSYEPERRPVAERVVDSGVAAETAQLTVGDPERQARDEAFRGTFADPNSSHHEAVAAAELDRCYASSPIVSGDEHGRLGPGDRLPETMLVEPFGAAPCALHELTHRPGHTLLVLGSGGADPGAAVNVAGALEAAHGSSPLVDAVAGLSAAPHDLALGTLDDAVAGQLGIDGLVILAVRPDRYIGLRHDREDPGAVGTYLDALTA